MGVWRREPWQSAPSDEALGAWGGAAAALGALDADDADPPEHLHWPDLPEVRPAAAFYASPLALLLLVTLLLIFPPTYMGYDGQFQIFLLAIVLRNHDVSSHHKN